MNSETFAGTKYSFSSLRHSKRDSDSAFVSNLTAEQVYGGIAPKSRLFYFFRGDLSY
jgi:hypothetical protein